VPVSPAAAATINLVEAGTAGFVGQAQQGPLDQPVLVESYAQFTTTFGASTGGLANPYLAPSVAAFFINGGQHLWIVRVAGADDMSLIGVDGGFPGSRTGLQALRDIAAIAVVAIPGATSTTVQSALITHCEGVGRRLAILDAASTTDVNAVIAQRSALMTNDGYAALYFPWVQAAPAGVSLLLPPSGFVAGLMARTWAPDTPTGVATTATAVSFAVNTAQLNQLTPLGINTLRFFAGQGVLVWGARTLADNPEWMYASVRRSGSLIDASIRAGTAWCLTQPNDAALWSQLGADVSDFLLGLWQTGWFPGTTPAQSFFSACGPGTMTQADLDAGRTIIQVGFAPIRPAEFIILRIVQQRNLSSAVTPDREPRALSTPCPNPFNPRTTIAFTLPAAGPARLAVYDPAGRLIRTLVDGEMAAGRHEVPWDGRDGASRSMASGTYLARLQYGDRREVVGLRLVR
jgi:uncharacterized protein